jgi:predicted O-methyltransferase YrrM
VQLTIAENPDRNMPSPGINALHYIRYRIGLDRARTQTTEAERELMAEVAPGRKVLVELGVFEGVSSRILRGAMDRDAELYCVDPFPAGRLGFSPQESISERELSKVQNGKVQMLRCFSYEALENWSRAIDLLYLDSDHSFEGVCRDFRDWTKFVSRGGLILIHTSRSCPAKPVPADCGPLRLVAEVVSKDPAFKILRYVDSMTVVEKL